VRTGEILQRQDKKTSDPLPSIPEQFNAAVVHHQAGRLAEAERSYRQILALHPNHANSLHMLGVLAFQTGHHEDAIKLIQAALHLNPNSPSYYSNLGNVLQAVDRSEEARAHYEKALALKPDYAEAHMNLGNTLNSLDRLGEAIAHYQQALALRPDYVDAHMNFGSTLRNLRRLDESIAHLEKAVSLRPDYAEAHMNLGNALQDAKRFDEAIAHYERALALRPDYAKTHTNFGNVLHTLNRSEESIAHHKQAIALSPNYAEAYMNLGIVLLDLGRTAEAEQLFAQAISLKPDYAEAHLNLGMSRLQQGDFSTGWKHYEWRTRTVNFAPFRRHFSQPQWQGEPLQGRRIFLHGEQGLGDCIQFLRYLPLVQAAGGTVIVEVPKGLKRVASHLPGIVDLLALGEPLPAFDLHCSLMSLPAIFRTDLHSIPSQVPYLTVPAEARQKFAGLAWPATGVRMGLVWAGNPSHPKDKHRSIPLSLLEPLFQLPGIHGFSLQKGEASAQIGLSKLPIEDFMPMVDDMEDTAALISQLDLVITVDTSVAHLAGALGKPVWLLLSTDSDWRWLTQREDSPWYPTARLFWQTALDNWSEVIGRVASELQAFSGSR
jgi:tetratricopeptide (TPR) repeat protein